MSRDLVRGQIGNDILLIYGFWEEKLKKAVEISCK